MPLRLTPPEWLLNRLTLLPTPLFDTPLAPGLARVLATACELDIFETLHAGPATLEALAATTQCQPQSLSPLLQLLRAAGYLRMRGGRYANSLVTRRWLLNTSPVNIAPYIIHSPDIIALWEPLTAVVRSNQPLVKMPYEDDSSQPEVQAALARHYAGLAALATVLGREIVSRVHLPTHATRLLDVGGSHGAYSTLFCRKYPTLRATILDLPPGVAAGKLLTPQMGAGERIDFVCLDLLKEPLPADLSQTFDVALYFHMAHLLSPEINQQLLQRVTTCLKPGGQLIFVDQITDQKHASRLATMLVQLMALTMISVGGTCYPFTTVKSWLESSGMSKVQLHRLLTPGATLITAHKN